MKSEAAAKKQITVEIIAVSPHQSLRQSLDVPLGSSIHDLRHDARLNPSLAAAWHEATGVGVFGEKRPLRAPLADGDRVELWRDLVADPKEARRERAKAAANARKTARKQARRLTGN